MGMVGGRCRPRVVVRQPVGVSVSLETPHGRIAAREAAHGAGAYLPSRTAGLVADPILAGRGCTGRPRRQAGRRTDVAARAAVVQVSLEIHARRRVQRWTGMSGRAVLHGAGAIRSASRGVGAPHASSRGQTAARAATDAINTVVRRAFTGSAAGKARGLLRRTGSTGTGAVVSGGAIGVGAAGCRLASCRRGTGEAA